MASNQLVLLSQGYITIYLVSEEQEKRLSVAAPTEERERFRHWRERRRACKDGGRSKNGGRRKSGPSVKGHLKINVDASWTENQREGGSIAGLCRDENGVLRDGEALAVRAASPRSHKT